MRERQPLPSARRVVVKVGTAVVTRDRGGLALGRLGALVEQLLDLRDDGREVLLVSSGSIGLGATRLGFDRRPTAALDRQAAAAAGQGALMALYDQLFRQAGITCAQVLLTDEDFLHRERYLSLSQMLERLLGLGALPVINENDTVSTAELEMNDQLVFGDNDRLSALVAAGLDADLLVMLTDVDGLHTAHPHAPGSERIAVYGSRDYTIGPSTSGRGTGGMGAKIEAARLANSARVHVVVASGLRPDSLKRVVAGDDVGTVFPARLEGTKRRRWLQWATRPAGRLVVNGGARRAIIGRHASLLPVGVVGVEGEFEKGAVLDIAFEDQVFARGLARRPSSALRAEVGQEGEKPAVHRNDIVILRGPP